MAEVQKEFLKDIAIMTGAKFIRESEYDEITLSNMGLEHLGGAKKIVITANDTHIIGPNGSEEDR
jgi:chaperonin GroEL (HSP60 family)